nr:hypothetical protein [Tanacetum cinerariifolium]
AVAHAAAHAHCHFGCDQQGRGGRHGLGLYRAGLHAGSHQSYSGRKRGPAAGRRPLHERGARHHQRYRQRRGHASHCQERRRI